MEQRPTALAGWLFFLELLFLSVFYFFGERMLAGYSSAAPLYAIAITETAAFIGTALLLPLITGQKLVNPRRKPPSVVYVPLIVYGSVAAGIIVYLVNSALAFFTKTEFSGLTSLYPALGAKIGEFPGIALLLLVLLPSVCEEFALRGRIYPLLEERGTAAAVFVSAVAMPLLYVYPGAATAMLLTGAAAALMAHYSRSLIGAMAVQLACRFTLWLGDRINASPALSESLMAVNLGALVLLCLFLFLFMGSIEGLLKDKLVIRAKKGGDSAAADLWGAMYNPGFLLFILLYIARLVIFFMRRL